MLKKKGKMHKQELQERLQDEIQYLKSKPENNVQSSIGNPQLEKKYRDVVLENKKMMTLLKDQRKFDIYLL